MKMIDAHVWEIITALCALVLALGGYSVKEAIKRLDEILKELKLLNKHSIKHEQELLHHAEKLKDHEERLRELETT